MSLHKALKPIIFRSVLEYRAWRHQQATKALTIGFVPTMGALHAGHISLVHQAASENSLVVMSIFVNPAQFAPNEDLDKYPRPIESDLAKICETGKVDAVFLPSAQDLYPSGIELDVQRQTGAFVSVLGLSHQLEGAVRPHFFRGVATVLAKFLNIIQPTILYLGQKDIQQSIVVRRMMRDLCYDAELRIGQTVRESDGLAMSSRNVYLSAENRKRATCLSRGLFAAEDAYKSGERNAETLRQCVRDILASEEGVEVEYVSVAHMDDLRELNMIEASPVVCSAAIRLGPTRILDNVILQ
ncbi:pantoate/beta-alanine ligase [Protomyces lactucae-debilis]|uniref:Pantoate--beta-alanine ligase n=1 Tax=Protomyces lactucae-debilis TaxID=2754530 RepID=A0A1Y2FHE8_PROLT|nr:pantoate/beta-alanine ligase [Protomyces lactucae-debilis]ORY82686.1 pantoate/beta-alanine ligase [Protomyces lactucae-debilis]